MGTFKDAEKKMRDVVQKEVEHLEHNFQENFPNLTGHAPVTDDTPHTEGVIQKEIEQLEHNFQENFPNLTGHAPSGSAKMPAEPEGTVKKGE
ncbi:hypothetical protein Acife_1895 [Acidithiobacillus ferrivorans SS3]|uniref:Uncharacterized protein n=1 Tax=Acidithiobacillus ferrivorans SS3 TaxID=743299 RepID=G0JL21_9PROT|nr:hypothetical protein [Acidithiobacillus ferrivorans]AEM48018.1 hypothetical protein Acife_1895 [Acidithiobacillus ferrivorans SS3]